MNHQNRRTFLKKAGTGALAGFAISTSAHRVLGANDTINVCVCGIHGRGQSHIDAFAGMDGVRVSHLVDPDKSLFGPRSEKVKDRGGNSPTCMQDVRKALEDDNIDALSIATPNHWHSLISIWACEAGKDVYVEKPLSHNVFEGRQVVEAARKHNRIVQHGTQSRSSNSWHRAIAAAASGKYGKLLISYGYASKPRRSIGFAEEQQPPDHLDYNLWLGPAQKHPYHSNLVHYNWHWFWDFGNGEIGNQGVHQMDIARWAVTECTGLVGPKNVISLGGRFGYDDQGQTPNTQLTIMDFGDTKLFFEDYGLVTDKTRKVTNEFIMEEGVIKNGKFYPNGKDKAEELVDVETNCQPGGNFGNFINCVRSRNRNELNAEALEGHHSALLSHLGNISYRLGEKASFAKSCDALKRDPAMNKAYEDMKQHLRDHTDMKLDKASFQLGRLLQYDASKEKFKNDDKANKMITRNYREPFVVS